MAAAAAAAAGGRWGIRSGGSVEPVAAGIDGRLQCGRLILRPRGTGAVLRSPALWGPRRGSACG